MAHRETADAAQEAKRDVNLAGLLHRVSRAECDLGESDQSVEGAAVRDGLGAGDLNIDQAGVITRALEELPEDATTSTRVLAERLLVDEASMHGPAALTQLGHRIAERVDPEAADRKLAEQLEREERDARRLRSGTRFADGHGSVFYRFRIPVGDDAFVSPILDGLAAPNRRARAATTPTPGARSSVTPTRSSRLCAASVSPETCPPRVAIGLAP